MALATATISYDLADLTGVDFDYRRTKVWTTTNIDDQTVIDTEGNAIRLGSGNGSVASDGTGSVEVWIPGTGSNPASWQTYLHVDYPDRNANKGRGLRTFGPFTITVSANLADLVTEMEVPPETLGGDAWLATIDADDTSQYRQQQDARLTATIATLAVPSGEYTVAVIPDTQYLAESWPAHFQALADYLTTNADALNLQLVLHVGDVVNKGNVTQFGVADGPMSDLFGIGVPVLACIGNHDLDAAYDPTPVTDWTATTLWNTYLGPAKYNAETWFDGDFMEVGKSENMYLRTTLGGRPTLVLSLEWGPREATMDWADGIVADHPNHDVIVVTHSWLDGLGEHDVSNPGTLHGPYYAGAQGASVNWPNHMRAWPNLVAVFNGHYYADGVLATKTDVGDAGNAVFQEFNNWQEQTEGGQGRVVLFTINPVNRTARRRVYNAATAAFETEYEATIRLGDTIPKAATDVLYAEAALPAAAGLTLGTAGAYVVAPHNADANLSDIDLRARLTSATWAATNATASVLVGKWTDATQKQYALAILPSGQLLLYYSLNGTTTANTTSTGAVPFADGDTGWVRVTRNSTTGAITFYTSTDYEPGVNTGTWTELSTHGATAGALFSGTSSLMVGSLVYAAFTLQDTVHDAEVWQLGGAAPVAEVRFDEQWTTYTDDAGHVWEISGTGTTWETPPRSVNLAQQLAALTARVEALEP